MYWWKTWADWYQDNIIIATIENVSTNIVYVAAPVKKYLLKNHLERCKLHRAQRVKLPEADNKKGREKVKFTKTEYQLRLPFAMYTDFKSILRKQDSYEPSSSKFFITMWQLHLPKIQWWTILWTTSSEYRGWHCWKVFGPGPSFSNHL